MMNFGILAYPTASDKTAAWEQDKDHGATVDAYVFATTMNEELNKTTGPIMAFRDITWTEAEVGSYYQTFENYASHADNVIGYAEYAKMLNAAGQAEMAKYVYDNKIPPEVMAALPNLAAATNAMQLFFVAQQFGNTVFIPCYYSQEAVNALLAAA